MRGRQLLLKMNVQWVFGISGLGGLAGWLVGRQCVKFQYDKHKEMRTYRNLRQSVGRSGRRAFCEADAETESVARQFLVNKWRGISARRVGGGGGREIRLRQLLVSSVYLKVVVGAARGTLT